MKKALKFGSPVLTVALFAVAGILLLGSSIGGARAALTYFSEIYASQIEMYDIGVTLNENGKAVSNRDYVQYSDGKWDEDTGTLLANRWQSEKNPDKEPIQLGRAYEEVISATNSGTIDEYVRISLYTYWVKDGKKLTDLDPELIELHPDASTFGKDWLLDKEASTPERKVYYYSKILPTGATTSPLTDTLTVSGLVASKVTQTIDGNRIITTYDYDGVEFKIEAEVDAVQTHNAVDAIWSAWGRKVKISNGHLSLE